MSSAVGVARWGESKYDPAPVLFNADAMAPVEVEFVLLVKSSECNDPWPEYVDVEVVPEPTLLGGT